MIIDTEVLEELFAVFIAFISSKDNEQFTTFQKSKYIDIQENYKYSVYKEAKENLGNRLWKPENIGTGIIQASVTSAIQTKVNHKYCRVDNNLINWRDKDNFSKLPTNKILEEYLFKFYKSKIKDSEAFEYFVSEKFSYPFIAYLFFIKEINRFLPIAPSRFDEIFDAIGISEFKTLRNASWDNYSTFIDIIKQIQQFLKTKGTEATLLDAHSFLWIFGNNQNDFEKGYFPSLSIKHPINSISKEREEDQLTPEVINIEHNKRLQETTVFDKDTAKALPEELEYKTFDNELQFLTELPSNIDSDSIACWLEENERRAATLDKNELAKRAAIASPIPRKVILASTTVYIRNPYVAMYTKMLAKGKCDLCKQPAPFLTVKSEPYLESHHVIWLSRGGWDVIENIVALCPNCHRKMHKRDERTDRELLISRIFDRGL